MHESLLSRRQFTAALAASLGAATTACAEEPHAAGRKKAQIAITLDLEMSREYPRRGMTEWDYEKGNLDEPTKQYAVRAAEIVRQQRRPAALLLRRPGVGAAGCRVAQAHRRRRDTRSAITRTIT